MKGVDNMSDKHNEDMLFGKPNSILVGDSKPEGGKITYRKGDIIINIGENMENEANVYLY